MIYMHIKLNAHRECYQELKAELQLENMHADEITFEFGFYRMHDTVHSRKCPFQDAAPEGFIPPEPRSPWE